MTNIIDEKKLNKNTTLKYNTTIKRFKKNVKIKNEVY